jgi:hypothetical protein
MPVAKRLLILLPLHHYQPHTKLPATKRKREIIYGGKNN